MVSLGINRPGYGRVRSIDYSQELFSTSRYERSLMVSQNVAAGSGDGGSLQI
jgi:hypothetical protein